MKKFTTLIASLFLAVGILSAQVVLVNSPEEVARAYQFDLASGWGADLTTDVWTGDAEFVDDGSGETSTQGCGDATNDLTGKIALIDRGGCEFGLKALNAENAGAIGAIIFNNQPGAGTIPLGGGAVGGQVTIPTVMLSYEDGQAIRAALENSTVNISMGNIVFDNNVSYADTNIINAPYGTIPLSQLEGLGLTYNLGATVNNDGLNSVSGISINGTVTYSPLEGGSSTEVYNESATLDATVQPDSISELILLPEFTPANGIGQYTTTYTVSFDVEDELPFDNEISTTYTVNETLMSKARWDPATNAPARTSTFYTSAGGGAIEFVSPMYVPAGQGYTIDTIYFHLLKTDPNLAGIAVEGYVYEWNDANQDTLINNDEITIVGIAPVVFDEGETATSALVRAPILDYINFEPIGVEIPADNKYYIFGARYSGDQQLFFGFDEAYDFSQYEALKLANGTFTELDYNYVGTNTFLEDGRPDIEDSGFRFTAVSGPVSIGIHLTPPENSTEEVVGEDVFKMNLFPNPTTEVLNVTIDFQQQTSFVEYRITDAAGRLLFTSRDNDVFEREQANFNVKALPNGQYFLTIRTEQGIQASSFMVKH